MNRVVLPRPHFAALLVAAVISLAAAAVPTLAAVAAVDGESLHQQIDSYLSKTYQADQPGAAVIVTKDGETLFRGAYGMANLELGVSLEPDMVFRLGSITKQFTGAAILLLEQEGKLAVDDPITKFLPDYPTHGHDITVAHLLSHTSGIRSYTGIPGWMQTKIKGDMTLEELVDGFKSEPMDFAPGERFLYNNSGFVLLGAVIEAASGMTYEEFLEQKIFGPLEMESSDFGSHDRIIPRRASGYGGGPGDWKNAQYLSMTQPHAAGSLLSTVDDMAKWDRSLYTEELFEQASMAKIFSPFALNSGDSTNYAYGFFSGELRGHPSISHGGGIFGFRTHGLRLPEQQVYVAVLTNAAGHPVSPGTVAQKLAAIAIGDPFPDFKAVSLDSSVLDQYQGVYRIDDENTRAVTLHEGKLFTQRTGGPKQPISPSSETDFFYPNSFTHLSFVRDGDKVSHMLVYQNGAKEAERADLTDEALPETPRVEITASILERYVGDYELRPGFELTVTTRDGKLFGQATGQPEVELVPISNTEFWVEIVNANITFVTEGSGNASKVILEQGGQKLEGSRITGD